MFTFEGSGYFRQRLVLSTLSGRPVVITKIREDDDEPGIKDYEISFIRMLESLTNGTKIIVNETGTELKYRPGILLGGKLEHDCCTERSIGYYLESLLCLAPFCKKPLDVVLRGVTNDHVDPTVDAIKLSSIPVLKCFVINDENLELKIVSRGMAPGGGGEVHFHCPIINYLRPIKLLDPGKIKRVRGVAYSARVSHAFASRMVDTAKGLLLKFLPDVYIYTDHYKGKHSGKSSGFGITLVAESTTGAFLVGEAVSKPHGNEQGEVSMPEDLAQEAVDNLLEEVYRGGCVDSNNQSLLLLFMVLGNPDVSKVKIGPLSPYSIQFLRHIENFLQIRMKLETDKCSDLKMGSHKVLATCVGIGFSNISKIAI